jgi:hypothetical protein
MNAAMASNEQYFEFLIDYIYTYIILQVAMLPEERCYGNIVLLCTNATIDFYVLFKIAQQPNY